MSIGYLEVQMHLRDVETADVDRLLRVLHEMGGTYTVIEHAVARAVGMPPDVEAPPAQWWESLEEPPRGGPRANIYTAHANVQMYAEPFFDVKDGMIAEAGYSVEVWHKPVAGSGWICIFDGPRQLWVRGEEMRENA